METGQSGTTRRIHLLLDESRHPRPLLDGCWTRRRAPRVDKRFPRESSDAAQVYQAYIYPGSQKNAKTPLAEVYDDKSVLEQMHYALMVQVMRVNGLAVLVDRPCTGQYFRKMLYMIVIATDMSVHDVFMKRFQDMVSGEVHDETERRVLVCQAIIKCADISNPVRAPNTVRAVDTETHD